MGFVKLYRSKLTHYAYRLAIRLFASPGLQADVSEADRSLMHAWSIHPAMFNVDS
jgi:hypothetical protein